MAVGEAETPSFLVESEDAAWKLLKRAVDGEFDDLRERPNIQFADWARLSVHLGIGESTITPREMRGLLAMQEALHRTYAIFRYDTRLLTTLSDEERDDLQIIVKVSPGSSNFDIDLNKILERVIDKAGDAMEAKHWMVIALAVALILGGKTTYSDYLDHMVQVRKEEVISQEKIELLTAQKFLSAQETERMKVMTTALSEHPQLSQAESEIDAGKKGLLKSLPAGVDSEINGIPISGEIAHEIVKTARQRSEEVTIQGSYRILRVDASMSYGFRVKLENVESGDTFTTGVQDILKSEEQVNLLKDAEWAKRPVMVTINGKVRRGQIVEAVIIGVEEIPSRKTP
tara:strand:+ start:775 stop:1806 length:1032 start_codon:yes stop_codon:yes gene_type:complete